MDFQSYMRNWSLPGLIDKLTDYHNPADAAQGPLNQIFSQSHQYFDPFIGAGVSMIPGLQNQYGQLTNDPNGFLNKLGQGYTKSPGYDWQLQQATNAGNNAAAAGGMVGTPQHQQQMAEMAQGLASQDYNNYLNHVLGIYDTGLQGQQNMFQTGYGASSDLAKMISDALMSQASLNYAGANNENQHKSGIWGNVIGALGGAFGL